MAGHSKWKNIQHRKGAQDAKRGKIFTKIIKEITVSVKIGGPDPESNPRLRLAMQNARSANMPKDNMERAVKKALGEGPENYTEVSFEGYGPGGVAFFVECMTDNNTRTVSNIRSYFNKYAGSLGKGGCLQYVFSRKGVFSLSSENIEEEEISLAMIDAGAEDVEFEDGRVMIVTSMEDFGQVQKALQSMKIETWEGSLERIPLEIKEVDEKTFAKNMKLLDLLEDDDDVQRVYHNMDTI
ncbi:MAG: YebC/PmpR family DNA-binding transcriptional regulator [Bacteriovoracales bacterium]|nr:YebC/PmpR family DNA-binding transcriptional regulator [Bacteriovoracales bacterium]